MIDKYLFAAIKSKYVLPLNGIHGVVHWARVRDNGLKLAKITGASEKVVELFAFLHDSCRLNDHQDPDHGFRAAIFCRKLYHLGYLDINIEELELLSFACHGHSYGNVNADITVQTCWDADRLDLGRVGVIPHESRLCTNAAKDETLIAWAYARSLA